MSEYHAYDPLGHIKAIDLLLKNAANFTVDKSEKLTKTDYSQYGEYGDMVYGEDFTTTVYCDAAYSHLVTSSLATFFESLFIHEFHNIRDDYDVSSPLNNSPRWNAEPKAVFWDAKRFVKEDGKSKTDIFKGIKQLYEAIEIPIPIQPERWFLLELLFLYRNYIVHNGFEWRKEKISEFITKIKPTDFKYYFTTAKSGDDVWIIYMSKNFEASLVDFGFELAHLFDLWSSEKFEKFMDNSEAWKGPEK